MGDERLPAIIETAIQREQEAFDFYTALMEKITDKSVRETLSYIAREERKHKAFLEDYRDGKFGDVPLRISDVVYYQIAEHQQEPPVKKDLSSADVYLVAAHREKRSHDFYAEIAGLHPEGRTRTLLLAIANEELKHKEKMEYLYANTAFPQTDGG